jgi:UTP--glucose-1-phosphate uridylyltransferase
MYAIITAGGLGTRLLPATKEIPKEMLPVPFEGTLKPIIQIIFEQLFSTGVREFVVVVGRGKRVIEDHFTPDYSFLEYLISKNKTEQAASLTSFYSAIEASRISWINQLSPAGFGDAVLAGRKGGENDFMIVGADTVLRKMPAMPLRSILVAKAERPEQYGVVDVDESGFIRGIVEKPERPEGDIIALPYYRFDSRLFPELETAARVNGELQLTSGIQSLIGKGVKIKAEFVKDYYDLGTIENYKKSFISLLES